MKWIDAVILFMIICLLLLALWVSFKHFKGDCSCHKCSNKEKGR